MGAVQDKDQENGAEAPSTPFASTWECVVCSDPQRSCCEPLAQQMSLTDGEGGVVSSPRQTSAVRTDSKRELKDRVLKSKSFSRIPLRQSDATEDQTHPLAKPKDYCFDTASAQTERLRDYHRQNYESAEEELDRLEVMIELALRMFIIVESLVRTDRGSSWEPTPISLLA